MTSLAGDRFGPSHTPSLPGNFQYVDVGPGGHVSLDTVRDFERALYRAGVVRRHLPHLIRAIGKVLARTRTLVSRKGATGRPFIVTMMGRTEHRLFPVSLVAPVVVYAFDVWPAEYGWWVAFFRRHGIKTAFFTGREAANWFLRTGLLETAMWLPEATDVGSFDPSRRLIDRSISVLELGRRHPSIHEELRGHLADGGIRHLYQLSDDALVFPTRRDLLAGLADTCVSICYPAADTHPCLVRGGSEVLTQRYLEAFASACLVVGRAPADLIELFGFDPVISLDRSSPGEHVEDIVTHIGEYQGHVDRVLARVREVGDWASRVAAMLHVLGASVDEPG